MKTQSEIRNAFWQSFPEFKRQAIHVQGQVYRPKKQNEYNATIRSCFVDFVDNLHRNGEISNNLANNVTLR